MHDAGVPGEFQQAQADGGLGGRVVHRARYKPNNVRVCVLCKQDRVTKGGSYLGLRRIFICKECKEKREKRNEDRANA